MSSIRIHALQTGTVAIKALHRNGEGRSRRNGEGGSRPDGAGGSRPDGAGGSRRDGAGGSRPDGAGGSRPDGAGGSRPDGAGRSRRNLVRVLADRRWTEPLPILAWLIEHPEGLIVVDTGETARVSEPGYFPRWHPYFRLGLREWVTPEDEIGPQIRRLGFSPDDVRWVVVSHFHTDHAGGLAHFPRTEILCSRIDFEYSRGWLGRARGFLPQHWPDWFSPTLIEPAARPFGPFAESTALTAAGDVHLLPTPGHTPGHLSVALEDGDTVFLFAADASYTEQLMLAGASDGVSPKPAVTRATLERIQRLAAERPMVYLPSHDPQAATRLARRQIVSAPAP